MFRQVYPQDTPQTSVQLRAFAGLIQVPGLQSRKYLNSGTVLGFQLFCCRLVAMRTSRFAPPPSLLQTGHRSNGSMRPLYDIADGRERCLGRGQSTTMGTPHSHTGKLQIPPPRVKEQRHHRRTTKKTGGARHRLHAGQRVALRGSSKVRRNAFCFSVCVFCWYPRVPLRELLLF